MAPQKLSLLNRHAVPQNAAIVTLIAIWIVLLGSYFFAQTTLYISLLLISGFTGAIAWISLCWSQINFRRALYKAGYTEQDLQYKTPGSPYSGLIAITLMLLCLIILFFSDDVTYKIAFIIGSISVIFPIVVFKVFDLKHNREQMLSLNKHPRFSDIFPPK